MFVYSVLVPCLLFLLGFLFLRFMLRRRRSLGAVRRSTWRRISETVVLSLIIVTVIALGCLSAWNSFAVHRYRAAHPPAGTFYTVDSGRMRIDCTGQGSPTVILDAGLGNDGLIWASVQPALSRTTQVCSYDRAGFGWSNARSSAQDADHIATQLHALLDQAGIHGPIVLMAHSIGGIYIRDYASRYPQEISALVFVDGSTPLQEERGSAALRAEQSKHSSLDDLKTKAIFALGIPRLFGQCSQSIPGFSPNASRAVAVNLCLPWTGASISNEAAHFHQSGVETAHTGPYGDIPVLIFSHDPNKPVASGPTHALDAEHEQWWNDMQEDLKKLSTHSRRIIAKGSGHYVQLERTDLVIRETRSFLEMLKNNRSFPVTGATTTE